MRTQLPFVEFTYEQSKREISIFFLILKTHATSVSPAHALHRLSKSFLMKCLLGVADPHYAFISRKIIIIYLTINLNMF